MEKKNLKSLALKCTSSPAFIHNIMYVQFEHQRIIQSLLLSALKLEEWGLSIYSNFWRGGSWGKFSIILSKFEIRKSKVWKRPDYCTVSCGSWHFISGKNSNKTHSSALQSDKIEQKIKNYLTLDLTSPKPFYCIYKYGPCWSHAMTLACIRLHVVTNTTSLVGAWIDKSTYRFFFFSRFVWKVALQWDSLEPRKRSKPFYLLAYLTHTPCVEVMLWSRFQTPLLVQMLVKVNMFPFKSPAHTLWLCGLWISDLQDYRDKLFFSVICLIERPLGNSSLA